MYLSAAILSSVPWLLPSLPRLSSLLYADQALTLLLLLSFSLLFYPVARLVDALSPSRLVAAPPAPLPRPVPVPAPLTAASARPRRNSDARPARPRARSLRRNSRGTTRHNQ